MQGIFGTFEAERVLNNLANRKRVHQGRDIHIKRLYMTMRKATPLDQKLFINVFLEIANLGYGSIVTTRFGTPKAFKPNRDVREIGKDMLKTVGLAISPKSVNNPKEKHFKRVIEHSDGVIPLTFEIGGVKVSAEVDEKTLKRLLKAY